MQFDKRQAEGSETLTFTGSKGTVVVATITVALSFAVVSAYGPNIAGLSKYESMQAVNGQVTIPLTKVADWKTHYFSFQDGGKEIAFLIVKASDGTTAPLSMPVTPA